MVIFLVISFNVYKCLCVGQVIAYCNYQKSTIRHIHCLLQIPQVGLTKRCTYCKDHRDKVLHSGLSRLLKQQEGQQENRSEISSHTNYRYLNTPEKIQRMHSLHNAIRLSRHKISNLQCRLDRLIKVDGIKSLMNKLTMDFCLL